MLVKQAEKVGFSVGTGRQLTTVGKNATTRRRHVLARDEKVYFGGMSYIARDETQHAYRTAANADYIVGGICSENIYPARDCAHGVRAPAPHRNLHQTINRGPSHMLIAMSALKNQEH